MKYLMLFGLLAASGSTFAQTNACKVALQNYRGVYAYYVTYAPQDPDCMQAVRDCRNARVRNNLDKFECVVVGRGNAPYGRPSEPQPRPYPQTTPRPYEPRPYPQTTPRPYEPRPYPQPTTPRPYEPRTPAPQPRVEEPTRTTPAPTSTPRPRVEPTPAPRVEPVPAPTPRVEPTPAPTPVPTPVPVPVPTNTNTRSTEMRDFSATDSKREIQNGETVIFNNKLHIVVDIPSEGFLNIKPEGGNSRSIVRDVGRQYVAITRGCHLGICAKDSVVKLDVESFAAVAGIDYDGKYILRVVGNNNLIYNVTGTEFALTTGCSTTTPSVCVGNTVVDLNNVYWTVVGLEFNNKLALEATESKKIVVGIPPENVLVVR